MVLTKFIEGAREVEMDAVGKDGRVSVVSSLSSPIPAFSTIFFPWQFRNIAQIRAHDFYKIVSNTNGQAAQSKKCSNSLVIRSETEITWSSNENFHYLKYTRKTHTQAECWRKALLVLTLICFGTAHLRENMTSAKKINNLHDPKIPLLRICQKKSSQM